MEWGAGNVQSLLASVGHPESVWEEAMVKAGFYVFCISAP